MFVDHIQNHHIRQFVAALDLAGYRIVQVTDNGDAGATRECAAVDQFERVVSDEVAKLCTAALEDLRVRLSDPPAPEFV